MGRRVGEYSSNLMGTLNTSITSQISSDYLSYSLASLSRSIPDIYDGLIPSRRRLLQTMMEEGFLPGKPYVKCARTTGLTSAYYHPHGSAYGSLISMATPWTNNVPWVDCHGNIGSSVDGPAAERYVENRLRQEAIDILLQDRGTWETKPNYDNSRKEAVRFNSSLPTVLLNGDVGISVGYSTKLAPHNLKDIVEAVKLVCKPAKDKTRKANLEKARELLVPDFPTGAEIVKDDQLGQYLKTGSGSIRCRAKVSEGVRKMEGRAKNRPVLTFTHLPPGVNPERVGDQIKDGLEKSRIEGVAEVNDLSDLNGDCVEVVGKPGVDVNKLKTQIYTYTDLDTKYSAKTLVMRDLNPVETCPLDIVVDWVSWRLGRLTVKFEKELAQREERAEIVNGLLTAIGKMDAIIKKIRAAKDKAEAKASLMATPFKFTDRQAEAILEMKLRQLTNLDHAELDVERLDLESKIKELSILVKQDEEGESTRKQFMVKEVSEIGKKYGSLRKSELIDGVPTLTMSVEKGVRPVVSKPRFVKVDMKRGVVEQVKGPRGSIVLDFKDKLILMTRDGMLKKVPSTFKGTLSNAYSAVELAKKESDVTSRRFIAVFELEGQLKGMVLNGEDLCKTTSSGKRWLPEGSNLRYFGEGPYEISWVSSRKKPQKVDLSLKVGKPGGKGIKLANLSDIKLP